MCPQIFNGLGKMLLKSKIGEFLALDLIFPLVRFGVRCPFSFRGQQKIALAKKRKKYPDNVKSHPVTFSIFHRLVIFWKNTSPLLHHQRTLEKLEFSSKEETGVINSEKKKDCAKISLGLIQEGGNSSLPPKKSKSTTITFPGEKCQRDSDKSFFFKVVVWLSGLPLNWPAVALNLSPSRWVGWYGRHGSHAIPHKTLQIRRTIMEREGERKMTCCRHNSGNLFFLRFSATQGGKDTHGIFLVGSVCLFIFRDCLFLAFSPREEFGNPWHLRNIPKPTSPAAAKTQETRFSTLMWIYLRALIS